jgi:hypothetical protein
MLFKMLRRGNAGAVVNNRGSDASSLADYPEWIYKVPFSACKLLRHRCVVIGDRLLESAHAGDRDRHCWRPIGKEWNAYQIMLAGWPAAAVLIGSARGQSAGKVFCSVHGQPPTLF